MRATIEIQFFRGAKAPPIEEIISYLDKKPTEHWKAGPLKAKDGFLYRVILQDTDHAEDEVTDLILKCHRIHTNMYCDLRRNYDPYLLVKMSGTRSASPDVYITNKALVFLSNMGAEISVVFMEEE